MKWNIVCDSSCDITSLPTLANDTEFSLVPLKIYADNKEFVDNVRLDPLLLLEVMKSSKVPSLTTCPAPLDWVHEFEKSDYSFAITVSSKLSGSHNSALVAKDMVLEEFPNKKIHVFDSLSTSGGIIMLAIKINSLIKVGKTFEEIVNEIERYKHTLQLTFCLNSFENLVKSGRVGHFTGFIASRLGIKAIAKKTEEGKIAILSKQRGEHRTYKYIVEQMAETKNLKDSFIIISHVRNESGANKIKELLKETYNATNVVIIPCRGLCTYYADDGGLIVSY
jgi:DegV family protein with EDD domain